MCTLIGNRLRQFPEALALLTSICIAVVAIDFYTCHENTRSWDAFRASELKYEAINKAYGTGRAPYDQATDAWDAYCQAHARYEKALHEGDLLVFCLALLILVF